MVEKIDIMKGDKVAVLRGERQGHHGIITDIQGNIAQVIFPDGTASLPIELLQNFSAAARKAWQTRPDRVAGRLKDPDRSPTRMVSLRLEISVWNELGKAVDAGKIRS